MPWRFWISPIPGMTLRMLVEEARSGLERKSTGEIQELLDLFTGLLNFEPLVLDVLERDLEIFALPKGGDDDLRPLSISSSSTRKPCRWA